MQLTLRLRREEERTPTEYPLDAEYTMAEAQEEINLAIDHGHEAKLILENGDVLEFFPKDYVVLSVAFPTKMKERKR